MPNILCLHMQDTSQTVLWNSIKPCGLNRVIRNYSSIFQSLASLHTCIWKCSCGKLHIVIMTSAVGNITLHVRGEPPTTHHAHTHTHTHTRTHAHKCTHNFLTHVHTYAYIHTHIISSHAHTNTHTQIDRA